MLPKLSVFMPEEKKISPQTQHGAQLGGLSKIQPTLIRINHFEMLVWHKYISAIVMLYLALGRIN